MSSVTSPTSTTDISQLFSPAMWWSIASCRVKLSCWLLLDVFYMSSYILANNAAILALPGVPSIPKHFGMTELFALTPEFASVTHNSIVSHAWPAQVFLISGWPAHNIRVVSYIFSETITSIYFSETIAGFQVTPSHRFYVECLETIDSCAPIRPYYRRTLALAQLPSGYPKPIVKFHWIVVLP